MINNKKSMSNKMNSNQVSAIRNKKGKTRHEKRKNIINLQ